MNHFSLELSLVAVLPAIFLCGYIFYKDRIEREPIGLLAILFCAGAAAYIPTYFAENFIINLIDKNFTDSINMSAEGLLSFSSKGAEITHLTLCSFLGFSLIRICIKWLLLFFITHKNKNFNYLFDGIVYSVFLSLGFAISENIHFLIQNDLDMLISKLLTSVPCHLFIGILIGYYYTMWNMRFTANKIENHLLETKVIQRDNIRSSAAWLICSLLIPFIINGVYVFAGSVRNDTVTLFFYTAVFILFGISFIMINQIAANDNSYGRYLYRIIAKGHPELSAEAIHAAVKGEIGDMAKEEEK